MKTNLAHRDFLQAATVNPSQVEWPSWMPRLAFSPPQTNPRGDVMVVIFLRGAADVLNMVVPFGEEGYYESRPTIAVPRPDDSRANQSERAIDLDGFFGLHPTLAPLLPVWQSGNLGIIHACGSPDESRSHFKAMELMERGVDDESGPASGWIGRHLSSYNTGNNSSLRAIGLGEVAPRSLYGSIPVTAMQSILDFHFSGSPWAVKQMKSMLDTMYSGNDNIAQVGQDTLEMIDILETLTPDAYVPGSDTVYPNTSFGSGLKQIAMLIRAQVGLEVATVDLGGWDTHFAQGSIEGLMPNLINNLAQGMAAFHDDLHEYHKNLTVVVMSEFGRRVYENASLGTDHGHGSMMMLMGGNVEGHKVHGKWPGLADGQLFGPGDLAVTTDYRDVLGEVLQKRLNNSALDQIFPGYTTRSHGFLKG